MRQISLLFFFILLASSSFAQKAVLSGKIGKNFSDSLLVAINPNPLSSQEAQTSAGIAKDGAFTLEVSLKKATIAEFVYADESINLFLQPGDQLDVRFNGENLLKSMKFKGQGANENNFIVAFELKFIENENYQVIPENIGLNEPNYIRFLEERKQDMYDFLESYAAKNPVTPAFKNYMSAQIEYTWANDRIQFSDLRRRVMGGPPIKLSPEYYNFLSTIKLNNPEGLASRSYTEFLKNFLTHQATVTNHSKADIDYYWVLYSIAKEKLAGEPRDLIMASILFDSMKKGFIQYTNQIFKDFESLNTTKDINDFLVVAYDANKAFALGSPAPEFKLKSYAGETVSLSSFKGKIVYLNFWSTKCGLCQMDLPYAAQLEKEVADKNVVFVNIGVDGDEETWRTSVDRRKLKGVQLYATTKDDILKKYKVAEVPAYYLIDSDGTFISTKAKRPSNVGVVTQIMEAVSK